MRPGLRVAQLLNIAFDMGAWEILGSMANGCTLCLRGNNQAGWRRVLETVDIVISTPSILSRHDPLDYPNIKHVITGGEPCPQGGFRISIADNRTCGSLGKMHKLQQLLRSNGNLDREHGSSSYSWVQSQHRYSGPEYERLCVG